MSNAPENIDFELLTRYVADECNDAERAEVEAWIAASDVNKSEYTDFKRLYDLAEEPVPAISDSPSVKAKAALQKVQGRIENDDTKVVPIATEPPKRKNLSFRIAAAVVVLFSSYFAMKVIFAEEPAVPMSFVATTEQVGRTLPDGTVITLNKGSELDYPSRFTGDTREVTLVGEAYFEVERDTEHPFIIHTKNADVTVLGTSFAVKAYDTEDDVVVTVNSGKVKLADATEAEDHVILVAGEGGEFDKSEGSTVKLENGDPNNTKWATGILTFQNTELAYAFEILRDIYKIEVETTNPELLNCNLTVSFTDEGIDEIMRVIALTFEAEVQRTDNQFVFSGGVCN